MPQIDTLALLDALGKADAAGDTESAKHIAAMIQSGQDSTPAPTIVPPTNHPPVQKEGGAPALHGPGSNDPSAGGGNLSIGPFDTGIHTPQWLDRTLSGAGQNMVDTGKGIAQMLGMRDKADVDRDREINAPLDTTGAGLAGNIIGGAATMALPGMGASKALSMAGRAAPFISALAPELGGAAIGAAAPVGSGDSRLENAGIGAGAGYLGASLGESAQGLLRSGKDGVSALSRQAHDLAQRHGIDLTVPQLSGSTFLRHYSNLADALPLSGAEDRATTQRAQFNDALGRLTGASTSGGAITPDQLDAVKQSVGSRIGNVAAAHDAIPTQSNLQGMMDVLQEARDDGTDANRAAVETKIRQLMSKVDPDTGTIPGSAWRQANTALQRQIRGTTDGDLKHYLGGLQEHYMDMMQSGIPDDKFDAWQALRGQYRNIKSIEPLVEKGGNLGVSPALLRQRLIASKNNRGPMSDLGDLGQERIKAVVPNSGTAQKNMIAGAVGLGGHFAGIDPYTIGAAGINNIANRALNSKLATKYYMGRLPDNLARYVDPTMDSLGPGLAAASGAQTDLHQAADSGALAPGHADGGEVKPYKKSSFWDLVTQAAKEITTPSTTDPTDVPVGNGIAGVGSDLVSGRQRQIDDAVSSMDH